MSIGPSMKPPSLVVAVSRPEREVEGFWVEKSAGRRRIIASYSASDRVNSVPAGLKLAPLSVETSVPGGRSGRESVTWVMVSEPSMAVASGSRASAGRKSSGASVSASVSDPGPSRAMSGSASSVTGKSRLAVPSKLVSTEIAPDIGPEAMSDRLSVEKSVGKVRLSAAQAAASPVKASGRVPSAAAVRVPPLAVVPAGRPAMVRVTVWISSPPSELMEISMKSASCSVTGASVSAEIVGESSTIETSENTPLSAAKSRSRWGRIGYSVGGSNGLIGRPKSGSRLETATSSPEPPVWPIEVSGWSSRMMICLRARSSATGSIA